MLWITFIIKFNVLSIFISKLWKCRRNVDNVRLQHQSMNMNIIIDTNDAAVHYLWYALMYVYMHSMMNVLKYYQHWIQWVVIIYQQTIK